MPAEYEHSSFQYWTPKHKMEIFQNWSNNFDYISVVYGDHFPEQTHIRGALEKIMLSEKECAMPSYEIFLLRKESKLKNVHSLICLPH
jgi:hypothetical protein